MAMQVYVPIYANIIIDTKLSGLLLDENPLNTEYLFEKMFRSTVAYGRKGAVLAAISAIDIALWDIKGLVMKQPVFMLLGGRTKANYSYILQSFIHPQP